jgi:predicted RecA/RadA family phage recombinase
VSVNFIQPGKTVSVVSPVGGLLTGQGVLIGNIFGVAQYTAAAGASAEITVEGVWALPKAATVTFAQGAPVYWDATAGRVTSVATAHYLIGIATVAAAAGDATVSTRLDGVATVASA